MWGLKGETLLILKRYGEALQAFEKSLKFDKKDADSWDGKAEALHGLNKHEEALQAVEKAIKFGDKDDLADYLYDKGDYFSHLGKNKEALEGCDKLLKIDPKEFIKRHDSNLGKKMSNLTNCASVLSTLKHFGYKTALFPSVLAMRFIKNNRN